MRLSCKDIDVWDIMKVLYAKHDLDGGSLGWQQIAERFPDIPAKLLRAVLRKMVRKNMIEGCYCGCSGAFRIIERVPFDPTVLLIPIYIKVSYG